MERLEIRREKIEVVWADHPVRYEDVSERPYTLDVINVDYVVVVVTSPLRLAKGYQS